MNNVERLRLTRLERICRELLECIGEDLDREGLVETPKRWARFWADFAWYVDDNTDTTFESITTDQMIVVGPVRVWSICEHHLLPFWCDVWMGYIPETRVLGLSKFARIAKRCGQRLQLQERLISDIADDLEKAAETGSIAVLGRGEHLCMVMRGIRSPARVVCSRVKGGFKEVASTRAEFLRLVARWHSDRN